MFRVRFRLPKGHWATYRFLDLVHDALVTGLTAAGATPEQVLGPGAEAWNFAALGYHRRHEGQVHSLVVSTPSPTLAPYLARLEPGAIRYARTATAELFDFSAAQTSPELPPVIPQDVGLLGVLTLSPLALRDPRQPGKRWHTRFGDCDLATAINRRLSRIAQRPVTLNIQPDSLYLRANPHHSVLVSTKQDQQGRPAFVIGLEGPLVLSGRREDLLLAWYAGLGEKTRNGFGCIGLADQGVGR